ncbi:MAG: hypothetical protein QXD95_02855 [Nitrososphaeria archaeon]
MQRLKYSLAVLTMVLASMSIVYGLMSASVHLRNVGNIKALGVGIYWDSGCSQIVTSIDWGLAEPGSIKNVTVYIRNEGNAPITLFLQTINWNPVNATDYISLSWNYSRQTIVPNEVVAVNLSLSISSNIQGITIFSFDIVVIGIG